MNISRDQFLLGLTREAPSEHWHQKQKGFLLPGGRKVTAKRFALILKYPQIMEDTAGTPKTHCAFSGCVNPKHLHYVDRKTGEILLPEPTVLTEEDFITQARVAHFNKTRFEARLALARLKKFWREHPISEDDPAVDKRLEFMPEVDDSDHDAVRALAADFGIIMA